MNKRFKIVSSLALAGMLVTGSLGMNKVLASTDNYTTNPVAVYRNLVEGKTVVPFVLVDRQDVLTVKDVTESDMFQGKVETVNGTAISSLDMVVGTGDKFTTTDGTEYTIIVYGDTNGDGAVNSLDALRVVKNAAGNPTDEEKFDDVQREAADVRKKELNAGKVNSLDALDIRKFAAGLLDSVIDELPAEEEPEVNYSITLSVNDNGYINNNNKTATKIGVKLAETSEEVTELKFKVLNADGEEEEVTNLSDSETTITVDAHTDYTEISPLDFSNLDAGKYTIQALDKEGNTVLGTINTEINLTIPKVAQVSTNRTSTTEARISLSAMGDSDIVKMYYVVVDSGEAQPTFAYTDNKYTFEFAGDPDSTVIDAKSMDISNNKLENAVVANELTTNKAYKVYYVIENSYGNQTAVLNADILNDTISAQLEKVGEITTPALEKNEKTFTWEAVDNAEGYIVTVYKDGKIIAEDTNVSDTEYELTLNGAGKYQISVIAKGDNTSSKNSEATMSDEVEVVALKAVTNIVFEINPEGKAMLSWTDDNNKDDIANYSVKLYKLDDKGNYNPESPVATETPTEAQQEITIDSNAVYKAEVEVVAKGEQAKLVNSEKTISDGFYKVQPSEINVEDITENSVTLTLDDVKINGKSATYKVKVYTVREDDNPEELELTEVANKDVELKDGKILVDGLESNKKYAFKLIADVDGVKGESDYISRDGSTVTLRKTPEINNLKVVKSEEEAVEGTIYKNSNNMIIDGEKHDLSLNYSTEFKAIVNIIDKLHANDIVTINGDTVTLNLPSEATDSSAKLDLGTSAKDMTVIIESNEFEKQIATTGASAEDENLPKEIILKGNGSRFNVSELNSKKITLTDGVTVTGDKEYTVNANTTATINGVKVKTEKETVINASKKTLNVTANKEANNLVFENLIADNIEETDATIRFIGSADLTDKQLGTITIKTIGGKVTVEQENVNVSSELNVEVNSGEVVIQNEAFTGDKNITVTNKEDGTTTVKAVSKTNAPVEMTNIELKEYTDEEFESTFPDVKYSEDIAAVREYINSFGINGKGATITVTEDQNGDLNQVEIVFSEAVENLNISNIK